MIPSRDRPFGGLIPSINSEAPRLARNLPGREELAQIGTDLLAAAAAKGDTEAVAMLYDRLVDPIYRYVSLRVRHRQDAEDVTQLVFERIVTALPRYRHDGKPFAAWAFRIARNAVIDHQRRMRPPDPLAAIAEPRDGVELEALSLRDEEIRELRAAMSRLTPDQREAIALRYAAELSAEEAAQIMGRQAGTIRGLTFRAIESLRRHLTRGPDR
jgi:RNA polymerase sigma-70 factor (ECF subfamily)